MKKRTKVIASALTTIALCLSLAVGGTFALFTSESKVDVNIATGTVNVEAKASDLTLYSPTSIKSNGTIIDDTNAATESAFANGGTATLSGNTFTFTNLTPGDKATFKIVVTNKSTVNVKYRTSVTCVADNGLYAGLQIKIGLATSATVTEWETLSAPAAGEQVIKELDCSVELPATNNDDYQGKTCKIAFTVEAVQGNVVTADDTVIANASNVQAYLDGAFGSIDGKTILLEPGVYEKIEFGRATKHADSNTQYYIGGVSPENEKTFDEFCAIKNNGQNSAPAYYVRNMSSVTIKAVEGTVTIKGLVASSGHCYGTVYDYVLDKAYTSGSAYYLSQKLSNITFEGINFTSKVEIKTSSADTVIDGVSFKNCSFTTGGTASDNGQALRYYNESNNGNVKNLTVENCSFNNCYQGVYTQKINGITVTGCHFDTTGHNAIAVQSGSEAVNHKAVVITGNNFANIGDRIIRFGDVGADTQITIRNNVATNSGDSNGEVIKAQSLAEGVTYSIGGNNWGAGKTVANTELQDR